MHKKWPRQKKERNREVLLKLLRSVDILARNIIPHSTIYGILVDLQVANGDQLLERHIKEHPLHAQYTSRYSAATMVEAIDTRLERERELEV